MDILWVSDSFILFVFQGIIKAHAYEERKRENKKKVYQVSLNKAVSFVYFYGIRSSKGTSFFETMHRAAIQTQFYDDDI